MHRYFFEISYNGKEFFGWQRQPNQLSVQEELEEVFTSLHSGKPMHIVGCGRTDTGVHAKNYFFHIDLENEIDNSEHLLFKMNRMLSKRIAIHSIRKVSSVLHARFSANKRTYRYYLHSKKDVFENELSWYFPQQLDIPRMNEAAKHLLGTQDFTSLSKLHTDVKTNICSVFSANWQVTETGYFFEITADRFLRNMVRATVGTLIDVGLGKLAPSDIPVILAKKNRGAASISVPAHGLFLWQIDYDFN